MNKKITALVICFVFILIISGCGKNNEAENDSKESNVETAEGNVEIDVTGDMKNSVKLPENYPSDVFPVHADSFIASAVSDENGNSVLICYSNKSIKEVSEFYKKLIKDAQVMTTQNEEDHYMSMGGIDEYTYAVDVSEADEDMDYKTVYNISLTAGNAYDQVPETDNE